MLRRDGNVIGNPIETNSTSATGVFRISASQQKNILTKFPPHCDDPLPPQHVSVLKGNIGHATSFSEGLSPSYSLLNGDLLLRIASPKNWEDRSSSAFSSFQILDTDEFHGQGVGIAGYSVEITAQDPSSTFYGSAQYTRSAFGTIFITAGVASNFTTIEETEDQYNLPNLGTPFEDQDNYFQINLNDVTSGPVNRTGNTGLKGMPKDANYFITVRTKNLAGKVSTPVTSNKIVAAHNPNSNTAADPPGYQYLDIMLIGGGASSGRVIAQGSSGAGGAGAMVISYGHEVKNSAGLFTITVGTGGVNSNGGNTSGLGCVAIGGGRGANAGRVATASETYFISAALSGGCGGGNIGRQGITANHTSLFEAGPTGLRAGNTSGFTNFANFSASLVNVYENEGGGFQISAADTLRDRYSESILTSIQRNDGTGSGGGGGIQSAGNPAGFSGPSYPGNGKYICWGTPAISSSIPQLTRTPFNRGNIGSVDGGGNPDEPNQTSNNKGFYGAGGAGYNNSQFVSRGGGGLGKFEAQNFSSTIDGFTYSATGVNGTGSGGGANRSNNNTVSSIYEGNNGGDGLVIIRMAETAYSNALLRPSIGGSYDTTAIGVYRYFIFDGNGTYSPL